MDLDKMQATWSEMSDLLENQKKLTNKLIMEMTKERYKNKFNTISTYETIGAFICFGMAFYILLNLNKLDTWYLIVSGIFTLICLVILPILSLRSINRMKSVDIAKNNYKQTIVDFTKGQKQFLLVQKSGIALGYILIIVSIPVWSKLIGGKDVLIISGKQWLWFIPIMSIFLFFFS